MRDSENRRIRDIDEVEKSTNSGYRRILKIDKFGISTNSENRRLQQMAKSTNSENRRIRWIEIPKSRIIRGVKNLFLYFVQFDHALVMLHWALVLIGPFRNLFLINISKVVQDVIRLFLNLNKLLLELIFQQRNLHLLKLFVVQSRLDIYDQSSLEGIQINILILPIAISILILLNQWYMVNDILIFDSNILIILISNVLLNYGNILLEQ